MQSTKSNKLLNYIKNNNNLIKNINKNINNNGNDIFLQNSSYIGAVVEFSPIYSMNQKLNKKQALEIMQQNLNEYENLTKIAKETSNGQIIVFPEYGLTGSYFTDRNSVFPYLQIVPDPKQSTIIPCEDPILQFTSPILSQASCIAKKYNIIIVLVLGEIEFCTKCKQNCPEDNRFQFNTQIAFSETGQLIARYRKSHLYYEASYFDQPEQIVPTYFDSSFGVRFGMFICFDMMFVEPQLTLINKYGITDIVWSSWWVNTPPLITGLQVEQAHTIFFKNTNLLSSGIGLSWYNSGSGIYGSNGKVYDFFYNPTTSPKTKLMIAQIKKIMNSELIDNYEIMPIKNILHVELDKNKKEQQEFSISTFIANPGAIGTLTANTTLVNCSVDYVVSENYNNNNTGEMFGLISFSGIYNNLFPSQYCAFMICNIESCSTTIMNSKTHFDSWNLNAQFTNNITIIYPMVATDETLIVSSESFQVNDQYTNIKSSEYWNSKLLLNVALFGI
eukprot:TRINITY_DN810_c0_g6_i1.p1 TRINITY_DN810_c0_g6~~TRINITY_DN810_c0_g6_i1.p1  ORF type:complete len:503 (+),score=185.92 TRINITY_DN810_c0_g6_i1:42-1550(+)